MKLLVRSFGSHIARQRDRLRIWTGRHATPPLEVGASLLRVPKWSVSRRPLAQLAPMRQLMPGDRIVSFDLHSGQPKLERVLLCQNADEPRALTALRFCSPASCRTWHVRSSSKRPIHSDSAINVWCSLSILT